MLGPSRCWIQPRWKVLGDFFFTPEEMMTQVNLATFQIYVFFPESRSYEREAK